jgi:transposase
MATARPDDELWKPIEPLLPVRKRRFHYPGRRRIDDHRTHAGTLFVLPTGIAWQQLPQEPGYGSGMTCWRRLQERQQAGVLQALHERLLSQLRVARRLDLSRAVCDSASLRALFGGDQTGPSPVDRRKRASKHHLITDANGLPLGRRRFEAVLDPELEALAEALIAKALDGDVGARREAIHQLVGRPETVVSRTRAPGARSAPHRVPATFASNRALTD